MNPKDVGDLRDGEQEVGRAHTRSSRARPRFFAQMPIQGFTADCAEALVISARVLRVKPCDDDHSRLPSRG